MADFSMFSGDTKVLQVTLTDEASEAIDVSSPVEITWQLSRKVSSPALVTKTVGAGITITDGPAGQFEVALDPADTATLKGEFYHEIEVDDHGVISTVMAGTVTIEQDAIT